ncbi:Recombination-associated protein RdgC [Cupriavidus numazuensis]|uniref:Recombination-associated protein RdgC n=1 Tax=Cupriavidus numazuensis TaxID=221992 RepID=A0ABN7PR34_9BURK|nr:Recombination-associated protein RdgC [Cupriavidus numazuensis]
MWFKNLSIYRLPVFAMTAADLSAALAKHAFVPCTSLEAETQGFAEPRDGSGLVHEVGGNLLIALQTEKKLLPQSVIRDATKARAAEIEEQQGFKPGRKQTREIKEQLYEEMLPKAFSINTLTRAWIDTNNGWLVIDAASSAKRDTMLGYLFKAIDNLSAHQLYVNHSPVAAMTEWLATDTAPSGFTVDDDTTLESMGESRATIRIAKQAPDPDDVAKHIAAGKRCTRLAMTWNDRVSLVLTDSLTIKRVAALDVIKETTDASINDADERFDADFMLMAGELSQMLADLAAALGGERPAAEAGDLIERAAADIAPDGCDDPLYEQAVTIVRAHKRASISLVQRHLRIGYNRAARLIEAMEAGGAVSAANDSGDRTVLGAAA